ncbi:proteasome regulatory particle subunit [Parelaphostrongylus tenuis]|uniref:Proteasome regulatory particle subunit n=1 Tax=Parelaphostrongylus tenuis TaxID=148309 RepID=A0AAD5NAZ4_PARTN|nr:proteasome regulatory particle subunit [Parelaphostrongylus tenuis]
MAHNQKVRAAQDKPAFTTTLNQKEFYNAYVAIVQIHACQIELRLNHKEEGERLVDIKRVRVSAMYLKEIGDFAGYYREALRYLRVEDIGKMTAEEKHVPYQSNLRHFLARMTTLAKE